MVLKTYDDLHKVAEVLHGGVEPQHLLYKRGGRNVVAVSFQKGRNLFEYAPEDDRDGYSEDFYVWECKSIQRMFSYANGNK